MSPAVATSLLERRSLIRMLDRRGQDPAAIATEVGVGRRTVVAVLSERETDLERDTADVMSGWSPDCMDATDWTHWQAMNPAGVSGGKALKPCWDCPLEFAVEMRADRRCNGSTGRPLGRALGSPGALAALPAAASPVDVALLERARAHSLVDRLHPVPRSPEQEPAMPDAPPASNNLTASLGMAPEPLALDEALEQLASRAAIAATAWSAKLAAAEAAIAADDAWMVAERALEDAWSVVGLGVSYREIGERAAALVGAGDGAVDAGLEQAAALLDEARASVALDGETQVVSEPGADHAETIPVAERPPTPHQERELASRAPLGLTPRQTRVLAGLKAGKSRAAIADELGVVYQSVDGMIEAMAKKGLIPPDLFPMLPARFAKFATVQG